MKQMRRKQITVNDINLFQCSTSTRVHCYLIFLYLNAHMRDNTISNLPMKKLKINDIISLVQSHKLANSKISSFYKRLSRKSWSLSLFLSPLNPSRYLSLKTWPKATHKEMPLHLDAQSFQVLLIAVTFLPCFSSIVNFGLQDFQQLQLLPQCTLIMKLYYWIVPRKF